MLKKILGKIFVLLGIISFLSFGLPPKAAFALNFNPSFGISVVDTTAGANSDLTATISQPAGDDLLRNVTFNVPAGWDIASGTSLSPGDQVGTGTYSIVDRPSNTTVTGTMSVINDATIPGGAKAHWLINFIPDPPVPPEFGITVDVVITGDKTSGHTIQITRSVNLPDNTTPSQFNFTFLGKTATNLPVFTNPTVAGDYTWSTDMTSENGLTATRSQTLTMPGSVTPTGIDVTVPLGNNITITYSSVTTAGQTSIATSTTPPPEGTGQFQLSGGLYYDFNTTATISCPCTITLPYDPVTTPNPRIYHLESGVWVDRTTSVDTVAKTVTGVVSSFSFFAVGQPNFNVDWRPPIERAGGKKIAEFSVRIPQIPVIFALTDQNGDFVERDDASVEILKGGVLQATITPNLIAGGGRLYKADLKVKSLRLETGDYQARVKIGTTTFSPSINFILK